MSRKVARKRRLRRTSKQTLKHGRSAKRAHTSRAGRTGSIRAKQLAGLREELQQKAWDWRRFGGEKGYALGYADACDEHADEIEQLLRRRGR